MIRPTFEFLREHLQRDGPGILQCSPLGHPIPRFNKTYYRVFSWDAEEEGAAFLRNPRWRLCEAEFLDRMTRVDRETAVVMLYGERLPRIGSPLDPDHERWRNREWAPALDDDPDPEVDGGFR